MDREYLFRATKKDFKLDWFSGTGKGGQHRNKHQNCLRLTHIHSGIIVVAQSDRDRPTNLRKAFERIVPMLMKHYLGEEQRQRFPSNQTTIRTYHEPDNRVVDHESGFRDSYAAIVEKNNIGPMIEARRRFMLHREAMERFGG